MTAINLDHARHARLPKWAQQELKRLESDVGHWKRRATAGPEGSDTFVSSYGAAQDRPLGEGPGIIFKLTHGEAVEVRNHGPYITIMARGVGVLEVQPQSSNVTKARAVRDWW